MYRLNERISCHRILRGVSESFALLPLVRASRGNPHAEFEGWHEDLPVWFLRTLSSGPTAQSAAPGVHHLLSAAAIVICAVPNLRCSAPAGTFWIPPRDETNRP